MNIAIFFLLIGLTLFILLLIFQIILCSSYQFDSKDLDNLISNWKKSPILNFSTNFNQEGYNKNDYININGIHYYIKRMNKKYNYLYLKLREIKYPLKICGRDSNNLPIFFRNDEECPINFINFANNNDSNSTDNNYIFSNLNYSNNNTNGSIVIDVNYINEKIEIISYYSSNSYIYNNYENIFTIKSRIKLINIISLIIIILCIPFLIFILSIPIFIYILPHNNYYNRNLTYISYFIFFSLSVLLIISFLLAISWIKETNSIFEDLNLPQYKMKDRFYNIQFVNLCFINFLTIFIIFFNSNSKKYNFNPLILILLISSPIISSPIIIILFISLKPYYKSGEFNDLKLNYQKSPITEIKINGNFKFNYIYTDVINEDDEYINNWKGYSFNIKRMDDKYTYPYIINNNSKNKKKCGIDSVGNELYFPENIDCPINKIIINNESNNSLLKQKYKWITSPINNNTFIHYTNDNINGTILVDLRISSYYNDERYINNNKIDNDGYSNIDNNTDNNLFLYSRTYSGIENITKLGNEIFTIRQFFIKNNIIFIIFYIYILIYTSMCLLIIYYKLRKLNIIIFLLSLINFILSLIILILNFLLCIKNNKIRKEIIKHKYFYQDIEELGIFVFIIPISFVLTLIFLSFCIYLFFTTSTLKFSISEIFYEICSKIIIKIDKKERLRKKLIKLIEEKTDLSNKYDEIKKKVLK